MIHLALATRNSHKTSEFASLLDGFSVSDLTARPDLPAIEETGGSFEKNATLKAAGISRFLSGLVLSDDSGLEVAVLGGAPGVYSARYAGEEATDEENVAKVLHELSAAKIKDAERRARFVCVLALAEAGKILDLFRGTVDGTIAGAPRGNNGFGYDPIFIPLAYTQTFAELGSAVKNGISHRARAIALVRQYLEMR